jgi:hypothetical protein
MESVASFFGGLGLEQWLGIASAAIAVVSFVLNLRLVARQEKRNAVNLKMAHDSDIIRWSDEAIVILAEADEMLREKGVAYPDNDFRQSRSVSLARISAIIDRGRLFFPNRDIGDGHGADNEAAYQGHRQPALEALVSAYDLLRTAGAQSGPDVAAADQLRKIRRAFVAEVFRTVDPVRRGLTLKELAA